MMPGELHELSVAIGGLKKGMEVLERTVRENHNATTDEHRKVHDIVEATADSMRLVAADVAYMKPFVEAFRDQQSEKRGVKRIAGAFYALCGGSVAVVVTKLVDAFLGMRPHP